jgi:hypothetical protein
MTMNAELSTTNAGAAGNEPAPSWADGAGATQFGGVSAQKCFVCSASRVTAWIIPTDEELMIARHTMRVLGARHTTEKDVLCATA